MELEKHPEIIDLKSIRNEVKFSGDSVVFRIINLQYNINLILICEY
jgi:hypothetical protein